MTYGNRLDVNGLQDDQKSEAHSFHTRVKSDGMLSPYRDFYIIFKIRIKVRFIRFYFAFQ